jgi:hypothetical protein
MLDDIGFEFAFFAEGANRPDIDCSQEREFGLVNKVAFLLDFRQKLAHFFEVLSCTACF